MLACFFHGLSWVVEFEDPTFELPWKNNSGDFLLLFWFFSDFTKSELNAKTKDSWDAEDNSWKMENVLCLLSSAFKGEHLKSMLHASEVLSISQDLKDHICNNFLKSNMCDFLSSTHVCIYITSEWWLLCTFRVRPSIRKTLQSTHLLDVKLWSTFFRMYTLVMSFGL